MTQTDLLIVGGGPAGLTAALYARRSGLRTILLEKMMTGGQMTTTPEIENYPGFPTVTGFDLAQTMEKQVRDLGAEIVQTEVTGFSLEPGALTVESQSGSFSGRALILAMGASRRKLNIPGEDHYTGRGVSYCATCDGAFFRGKDTVVIGGGNTALEDAVYLSGICRSVTLVHRRDEFRGGKLLQKRVHEKENIRILTGYVPEEILGDATVTQIRLRPVQAGDPLTLPVSGVFAAIGTLPQTALLQGILPLTPSGHIAAGEDTVTSVPGVFAAGDLRIKDLYQIVTAVADGATAASKAVDFL